MTVQVQLFAVAKQLAGQRVIKLELTEGATLRELRKALLAMFPVLQEVLPHALFAVDAEYAGDDTPITEKSEVALIPPVSGG